ncbi:MAG: ribonuclease H family protein [Clostridia bacterium]|nr:ribonuclease H family protein [Clostridia bacterium]
MAKPKFYAVRVGLTTGVFRSWAECEPLVHGVRGAKYKSFPTEEQAQEYLNAAGGPVTVSPEQEASDSNFAEPKSKKTPCPRIDGDDSAIANDCDDGTYPVPAGMLVAFVDGSYDAKTKRYGYGCVLLTDDGREICENGWGDREEAVSSRNVAGELQATLTALRRAEEMGYKNIRICHDYNGIAAWFKGEWKANSFVAKQYVAATEAYRGVLNISFEKVAAHTGVKYNEMADRLAKDALGIE